MGGMKDWKTQIEGPFWPRYKIVVGGFQVPYLSITPPINEKQEPAPLENDRIFLSLDGRIGLYTTRDEVERWAPFLADCMAVAAGYPCHGAAEKMNPDAHKMSALGATESEKPNLSIVSGMSEENEKIDS